MTSSFKAKPRQNYSIRIFGNDINMEFELENVLFSQYTEKKNKHKPLHYLTKNH